MSGPAGPGVKVFSIGGRMIDTRQRCLGMTDTERQWRAQFLKDQYLAHDEPRDVPELYKDTNNFIRRLWKTPLWMIKKYANSLWGPKKAYAIRQFIGKGTTCALLTYFLVYHMKYSTDDWTNTRFPVTFKTRTRMYPDDPEYPHYPKKTEQEYFDLNFLSSPYAKKIEAPPPPPPASRPKIFRDGKEVVCSTPNS